MEKDFQERRHGLCQVSFDVQPTPILIASTTLDIVLVNQAARQLFPELPNLVGNTVKALNLKSLSSSNEALQRLLSQPISTGQQSVVIDKQNVEIRGADSQQRMTACLLISDFATSSESFRMFSFENVKGRTSPATMLDQRKKTPSPLPINSTCRRSSQGDQTLLRAKFSKLCDAIYHAEDRSGFLLSADNKFCYPNYQGSPDVTPVEIEDVDKFFEAWDVWTPDFSQRLKLSEYPSLWLNRERQSFRDRKYGLKEHGKNLVLLASGTPLFENVTEEFLGGVVWLETLGEHHDVEAMDLKSSLADFENVCNRLPHLLWTVNSDGLADWFSQSWYDFTGFTQKQSVGLAFTDAIDPIDMDKIWAEFHKAKQTNTEVQIEAKYRRHDGQWIWMYVRAKPLLDCEGNVLKWYGTSTNVHKIVQDRELAEKRKTQLMQMLAQSEIGLFEATDDGRIMVLEGRTDWLDEDHQLPPSNEVEARMKEHFRELATDARKTTVFETKVGLRWYKFRLVGNVEDNKEGSDKRKILGCSVDVTEQKEYSRLEMENIRLANAAALEMEKSRAKTEFLALMSHEIRTPIAGILGITEILAEICTSKMQRELLADLHFSAEHLLTIVNDILDLSKIEAGKLELKNVSYDIFALTRQVWKLFTHVARSKSLNFTVNIPPSSQLTMVGDAGRVRQIFNNLVSNALKFTYKGFIDISIEQGETDVKIVVQDSGIGIDGDTMKKLFHPFVQGDASTSRRYGGTGLGLKISRDLASMMGGKLYLESSPSKGTKAVLILPGNWELEYASSLSSDEVASPLSWELVNSSDDLPASNPQPDRKSLSQPYVLVVEDNAINQKVILNLVDSCGYPTTAVWNGQEALDFLGDGNKSVGEPSLVLMDCQMPQLDGYEATRRLRADTRYEKNRNIPVIALTASTIQGDREKCQEAGMNGYLSKPVSKRQLKALFDEWIPDRTLGRS